MEHSLFEKFIDEKVIGDKIKIRLKKIYCNLKTIIDAWICRHQSKTLDYVSSIKIQFLTYGIKMFQQDTESMDVLMGCFLYSQPIDADRIRCPKALSDEKKASFKQNVAELIIDWRFLGKHFSYEKCVAIGVNNEDRRELEKKLKEIINFG